MTTQTHRCLYQGCEQPPTQFVESDVGLEGSLTLYFCDEHAARYQAGDTAGLDLDHAEAEGNESAES